jgi:hypothetical protein
MADILIRGMEIPKNETSYVELQIWGDGTVYKRRGLAGKLEQIGTALPLPERHGRLIDADALLERLIKTSRYFELKFDIDAAPTIIPAEGDKIE